MGSTLGFLKRLWIRLREPFGAFFNRLALVIGILGGGLGLAPAVTDSETVAEWIYSSSLAGLAIIALGILAYREALLSRRSLFSRTLDPQLKASEVLRDLRIFLRKSLEHAHQNPETAGVSLAQARKMIEEIMDQFTDIYTTLTSTRCRFCVKLIGIEADSDDDSSDQLPIDSMYVFTLARDQRSSDENRQSDKERANDHHDILKDNSDFLALWDPSLPDGRFFISDDLREDKDYHTTSISYWEKTREDRHRSEKWLLWYVSTIVWPIRQQAREHLGISEQQCIGFLAVDCNIPGVFDKDNHYQIGLMLANSLYPLLDLYKQLDYYHHLPSVPASKEGAQK